MCEHTLWGLPTGLQCTQTAGHPHGHTYTDREGSIRTPTEQDGDE